ncbi:MAG: ABC transporter permease [Ignisphaera sp.]|nr:ABC transporter permease [Ignisphaera sp.]MDW8084818.1 ABC transporter permease [Ignisphaera sp.]
MPINREYIIKRALSLVFVVLGVVVVTFIITRVIPARPELLWTGPHATIEQIERARRELHLDKPIHVQLWHYFVDLFSGNWGVSWRTKMPVLPSILSSLPATIELVVSAFILATAVGIPLGISAAIRRGSGVDSVVRIFSVVGASTPVFWLALLLQLAFCNWLGLLPAAKRVDEYIAISTGFKPLTGFYTIDSVVQGNIPVLIDVLRRMFLPAVVLSLYPMCLSARMTRALTLEVLSELHVRSSIAWGIPRSRVLYKYVLRNVIAPVVASLGLSFGYTIVGAFMVEIIFVWPGIGYYTAMSLLSYDYPAIIGSVIFVAIIYSVINTAIDILHATIDPRVEL